MEEILQRIHDYSLEEIMGDRFGRYSKYIIQDRAIPDVRDGLKPVQRRILYAMYRDKNTYDKQYRKSVKTVGNVIGNYHPHGDSSVYEAMVRMSQWWKQNAKYIEMHGNNGSIDGDPAAAMRYTEARLSKISNELLRDIDRNTVSFAPNFDDTALEPTVLPSRFPNLLVNGATGISAGYATNIPPHNLGEVIDVTIKRIDKPSSSLEELMEYIKGPDFPTGGTIEGIEGIKEAYQTGKGRIILKSKISYESPKGKNQIIINEIPYEVNKAVLVRRIDEIRVDKKVEGIIEVRDESDRDGLRIAIDIKKEADTELIVNYLLKNTDLQISYNFNTIAIVNRRPKLLSLIQILDAYIAHQKEVVTNRCKFDLEHAAARLHIVEGLIKALSILDEVIRIIRSSENKSNAKDNLMSEYDFTEIQAEAIVMLQLYKLTNTDVTMLEGELADLNKMIMMLNAILSDENKLKNVIKEELRKVKKEYEEPRKSIIKESITEIKIDTKALISKEDVVVVLTNDGYIKRVSLRSYNSDPQGETGLKQGDFVRRLFEVNTTDVILIFTNMGNYLYVPVHEIMDAKWKDLGKHVSNIITLKEGEAVISCLPVYNFNTNESILTFTRFGMVKRTSISDYMVQRYSKPISAINLKDGDEVINVVKCTNEDIFVTTSKGYGLWYKIDEIPVIGLRGSGVKSINLKDDYVVSSYTFDETNNYVIIVTNKGNMKRIKLSELEVGSRAKRGILLLKEIKSNPSSIFRTFITSKEDVVFYTGEEIVVKLSEIPILDRQSNGTNIIKGSFVDCFKKLSIQSNDKIIEDNIVDDSGKQLTIDEWNN